jgi:hypothetical protein
MLLGFKVVTVGSSSGTFEGIRNIIRWVTVDRLVPRHLAKAVLRRSIVDICLGNRITSGEGRASTAPGLYR